MDGSADHANLETKVKIIPRYLLTKDEVVLIEPGEMYWEAVPSLRTCDLCGNIRFICISVKVDCPWMHCCVYSVMDSTLPVDFTCIHCLSEYYDIVAVYRRTNEETELIVAKPKFKRAKRAVSDDINKD